jgi:adenylosuccinate lyase
MRANLDRTAGAIMSEKAVVELTDEFGARAARSRVDQAVRRSAADGIGLRAALGADFDDRPETYLGSAAALLDAALRRTAE